MATRICVKPQHLRNGWPAIVVLRGERTPLLVREVVLHGSSRIVQSGTGSPVDLGHGVTAAVWLETDGEITLFGVDPGVAGKGAVDRGS